VSEFCGNVKYVGVVDVDDFYKRIGGGEGECGGI
jgi:hypothetical protein